MIPNPIFLIGTERSGSNLLRLVLDSHPRIAVPHPPHLVRYLRPLEPRYGDLSQDAAFGRLVDDALAVLRTHIHPWPVRIDRGRVLAEARPRDSLGITAALYEQAREQAGKARWACKSTFMVHEVQAVLDAFISPRFVLLVRDPRDVAASSRESVFSTFHPWFTARLWAAQQGEGLGWVDRLPPAVIRVLRYEDLVSRPELELRALCTFLGEEFHPALLRHAEGDEAARSARLSESWARTGQPISAERTGRWAASLTPDEVAAVEAECGPFMDRLEYRRSCAAPSARPRAGQRLRYHLQDRLSWVRVEARSLARDRNAGRRWSRGLVLARIRARTLWAARTHGWTGGR